MPVPFPSQALFDTPSIPDQDTEMNSLEAYVPALSESLDATDIRCGDFLYRQGDTLQHVYIIEHGQFNLVKQTDDGKELILFTYQAGDLLAEEVLAGNDQARYHAQAIEDSRALLIAKQDIDTLAIPFPQLMPCLLRQMSIQQCMMQSKMRDLLFYGKQGALCSTLIRMSNSYGRKKEDGIQLQRKLTNAQMGAYIGATRESVNRMLTDLKQRGVISISDGYITIHDLAYLQSVCHCEQCPASICRM